MLPRLVSRFPATAAEGGGMPPPESNALHPSFRPQPKKAAAGLPGSNALTRRRQKASTVSFKLAVALAFFGYLIALGMIEKNPATRNSFRRWRCLRRWPEGR